MNSVREFFAGLFCPAPAQMLAARELDDARRQLLQAQSAEEYAHSMAAYHQARIARLERYLAGDAK